MKYLLVEVVSFIEVRANFVWINKYFTENCLKQIKCLEANHKRQYKNELN